MKFPTNCEMELWEYFEDPSEPNDYGESKVEYDHVYTIPCNLQSTGEKDVETEHGIKQVGTFKAYFDIDAPIDFKMVLRVQGEEDTYEIDGKPIKYNHHSLLAHQKVLLIRHDIPLKLHKVFKKRRFPVDRKHPK